MVFTSMRLEPEPDLTSVERRNGPGKLVGIISLFRPFAEHLINDKEGIAVVKPVTLLVVSACKSLGDIKLTLPPPRRFAYSSSRPLASNPSMADYQDLQTLKSQM